MLLETKDARNILEEKWVWAEAKTNWKIKLVRRKFSKEDKNRWCLYITLRETHPLFEKAVSLGIQEDDYDMGDRLIDDFHGGCTYVEVHDDYIVLGCDFQHFGDEAFEKATNPEKFMGEVNKLYKWAIMEE